MGRSEPRWRTDRDPRERVVAAVHLSEPGAYDVVLHVGGLGGTGAATATVDTRGATGLGCATAPGGGWLVLGAVLALRRPRRC